MLTMALVRNMPEYFLALIIAVHIGGSIFLVSAQKPVKWDRKTIQAKQGDDVEVTCTMEEVGWFDVMRISKQSDEGAQDAEQVIADAADIKYPFSGAKRYNVTYKTDKEVATLTLRFKGIRGEDSGTIKCFQLKQNVDVPVAYVEIQVLVPVDKLVLLHKSEDGTETEIPEGEPIKVQKGKLGGFACKATINGSKSETKMRITVDDNDETANFALTADSRIIDPNGGLGFEYSEAILHYYKPEDTPEVTNPDFDVTQYNGKTLVCEAMREGFSNKQVSATVEVQYEPTVKCNKYTYMASPGASFDFTCEVNANPLPAITWQWEVDGEVQPIPDSMKSDQKEIDADHLEVTLHIKKVNKPTFTKYLLTAKNDLGTNMVSINLAKGSSGKPNKPEQPEKPNQNDQNGIETPVKDKSEKGEPETQEVSGNTATTTQVCRSLAGLLVMVMFLEQLRL